jgi:streptomycin 6-kinase
MEIPEYFRIKASRIFGDEGPGWVESLPSILAWCQDAWRLDDCRPVDDLSINLVCLAESRDFGKVVLKIDGPHAERYTEMEALRAYAGRHACALLRFDRPRAAMLLERLLPGTTLRSLPDRDEQLRIGTEMMATLPVRLDGAHGFPTYQDWLTRAFARQYRDFSPDERMKALMSAAQELYTEIASGNEPPVLLHGDFHHDNILAAGDGRWKVIDPQGVVGPAFLECGRFIQNHVAYDVAELDLEEVARTVAFVSHRLDRAPRLIASTFFILHLLSTCWSHESADDAEELQRSTRQCQELLSLARGM